MVTIKDVANYANVSYTTVSRCLNNKGYISEKTRERIQNGVEILKYEPNSIARSLVTKRSNVIGVIVPYIDSPFLSSFVEGVESQAKAHGYSIFLCHSHENCAIEENYLKLLYERRVEGIIATPVGVDSSSYKKLITKLPIILAIRDFEDADISSISVDNIEKSTNVARYLLENGHKKIGIIVGNQKISSGKKRWIGVLNAYSKMGIKVDYKLVRESELTIKGGYEATCSLIDSNQKITAIYAASNLLSGGALKALIERGYNVPEDISLAAFDGFEESYAASILCSPQITANCHPSNLIGMEAVNMLCAEINERRLISYTGYKSQHKIVDMEFIERESVKMLL